MSLINFLILFLLGLSFGSFLNVIAFRYNPDGKLFSLKSLKGRSRCPSCQKQLSWYELIPIVSFIIQLGKCRWCKSKISLQYISVEIASALIFVFVPIILKNLFFPFESVVSLLFIFSSIIWVVIFLSLILVFLIDLKHFIIPNSLNLFIFLLGIIWSIFAYKIGIFSGITGGSFLKEFSSMFYFPSNPLIAHFVGFLVGSVFFFLIVLLSKGRAMGMGDVKLIAGLGILFGFPDVVLVMALSFIIGAVASSYLMLRRKKKMSDKVPFGPFLVLASFAVFFFGSGLLGLYFGIIGM